MDGLKSDKSESPRKRRRAKYPMAVVLAAIKGRGHSISLTASGKSKPEKLRPIIVGYYMRFDFLSVDYPGVPEGYEARFAKYAPRSYKASKISIKNGTAHPVVLGKLSQSNTVASVGAIKDHGAHNTLKTIAAKTAER